MSWDSYIDNMKAQSADPSGKQHLSAGAIIALDGGSVWAQKDLAITPAEAATISKAFKSNDFSSCVTAGVNVGGIKYMYLQSDDKQLQAKKKDHGGLTFARAKQCVIIGKYAEGDQAGQARKAVEVIREYLESVGY